MKFDVFSLHNRWNYGEVISLLGKETPTFTIIRDPVDVFVSLFYYYKGVQQLYNVTDLRQFVKLLRRGEQLNLLNDRWSGQFGRNQMAWDLGIAPKFYDDEEYINAYVEKLSKEFDLVLVASRMDESLVLLRHLLKWPLERLRHLDRNKRKRQRTKELSTDERKTVQEWLAADTKIYNYFLQRFEEQIDRLNQQFSHLVPLGQTYVQYETALLKKTNENLYGRCVLNESSAKGVKLGAEFYEYSGAIGYVINQ